jgi:hypothetical protein
LGADTGMNNNETRSSHKIGPIILMGIGLLLVLFTIWQLAIRSAKSSYIIPSQEFVEVNSLLFSIST